MAKPYFRFAAQGPLTRLSLLLCLLVAGCAHDVPSASAEAVRQIDLPAGWTAGSSEGMPHTAAPVDLLDWIDDFGDPQLSAVVRQTLLENGDLGAAAQRVLAAQERARIAGSDRLPEVALGLNAARLATHNDGAPPVRNQRNSFSLEGQVSWELDLWGRLANQSAAAQARYLATAHEFASARLSLGVQAASAFLDTVTLLQTRELTAETLDSFEKNLSVVEGQFDRGIANALDLRLLRANVSNTTARLAEVERQLDAAKRRLEVLTGRYPEGQLSLTQDLPQRVAEVPAGLPVDLLLRRPDLLSAAANYQAVAWESEAAEAALLPSIRLTGSAGTSSSEMENLIDGDFSVWSLAAGLVQPLFQGGALRARARQLDYEAEAALRSYTQAVLRALGEVETALAAETYLLAREAALSDSVDESRAAADLAWERYGRGLADIVTVLEADRRAFNARESLLAVRNQRLQNRLNLYLALGGGFSAVPEEISAMLTAHNVN